MIMGGLARRNMCHLCWITVGKMPPTTTHHDQSKRFPHPSQTFFSSKFLGTSVTEKATESPPKEKCAGTAGGVEKD